MTLRSATLLIVAMLAACSRSGTPGRSSTIAPDCFRQDMNRVREAYSGKGCGPAPLGGWPPRPVDGGIVANAEHARSLGLVYLVSIYGKKVITLSLSATLKNGVWTVVDAGPGKGAIGGERYVLICRSSGAVLLTYKTQ